MMIEAHVRRQKTVEAVVHPIYGQRKIQESIRTVSSRSARHKQPDPPNTQQSGILLTSGTPPSRAKQRPRCLARRRTCPAGTEAARGNAQELALGMCTSVLVHLGMQSCPDVRSACEHSRSRNLPKTFGVDTQVSSPATMVPISSWRSALPVRLVGAKVAAAGGPGPNGKCLGTTGWFFLGWMLEWMVVKYGSIVRGQALN